MERMTLRYCGENVLRGMCTFDKESNIEPDDCIECSSVCKEFDGQGCAECPIQKAFDRLAEYEDADETGLIAACHCGDCKYVDWRSMSTLRIRCAKIEMYKDADDFCKYAKRSDKEDAQCRKCLCKSCMKKCGCQKCKETDGAVTFCASHNKFEQLSLFPSNPKPVRKKLPRFVTYDDYGISRERFHELTAMCKSKEYASVARSAAYTANPDIAEHILLSVQENKTYERVEFDERLGRIPCGRTDFYGYKRLFYHYFDEALNMVQTPLKTMR